jgi:hypothetical protein
MPVLPLAVNEPNFPYFGGTDNPKDDTSKAGAGVRTETGNLLVGAFLNPHFPLFGGQDTTIGVVPVSGGDSGADYGNERSADPAGTLIVKGAIREAGQDETIGETETSGGISPAAFPEPTP